MGLDFFRRSVELVEKHRRPEQRVSHTIQTNGTRIDDEWAAFFKEHGFLVGLSVDGPRELHDTYRVDKKGKGSFDRVERGWDALRRHDVDVNILCTVNAANGDHPLEVYRFFRDDKDVRFIQFIPIVERVTETLLPLANRGWGSHRASDRPLYVQDGSRVTDRTVGAEQFGRFLIEIFDEWVRHDVGEVFVQHFDAALANWHGEPSGVCIFNETCGAALTLEHNGDLYSCDHYVEPDYLLGNINETPMAELVASPQQVEFGRAKRDTLPEYCRTLRGPLRLPRRVPPQPLHHDTRRRGRAQLPVRRLQGLLHPHRPPDAAHVRSCCTQDRPPAEVVQGAGRRRGGTVRRRRAATTRVPAAAAASTRPATLSGARRAPDG